MTDAESRVELSPAYISGIRNALLEAVTDYRFAADPAHDQLARALLEVFRELANAPETGDWLTLLETESDYLRAHNIGGVAGSYEVLFSADVGRILRDTVEHVLGSLLEFELPIRIRLTHTDLVRLFHELSQGSS